MKTITWSVEKLINEIKSDDMLMMAFSSEKEIEDEAKHRFKNHVANIKKSSTAVIVEESETSITHYNNF